MKIEKIIVLVGIVLGVSKGHCGLQFEKELAQKFCPSLQLHLGDQGLAPKPVEIMSNGRIDGITSYLDQNDLWCRTFNIGGQLVGDFALNDKDWEISNPSWPPSSLWSIDKLYEILGEPIPATGKAPGSQGKHLYHIFFHYDFGGPGKDESSTWYSDYHNLSGLYNDTIYAHVFPDGNKAVIQYWFFYPFNDWVNNHEGDWEHINVGVSSQDPNTAKIEYVDYYFHGYIKTCTQPGIDFFINDYTHPVVFVGGYGYYKPPVGDAGSGEGSHGSYPVKGFWDDVQKIPIINDYVNETIDGSGEFLSYKTFNIKILPNKDEIVFGKDTHLYWMRPNLRWGHVECNSPGDWLTQVPIVPTNLNIGKWAPRGPNFKDSWNDTGDSNEYKWYPKSPPYSPVTNSGYTIPKVGIIIGRVINRENNLPLSGVTIKVLGRYRSATTDSDGRYRIALPVGKYDLKATKSKFYEDCKNQIDVIQNKEVSLDFVIEPFDSETTNNVYTASVSSLYKQAFKNTGLLATGVYLAKRVDVRADIPFIYNYLETPSITLNTNGWSFANPNYGGNWAHVISQNTLGFTARTCVYEVWNIAGQYLGWYPCKPQDVSFSYTISGKREFGTGSVSGKVILIETQKPLGEVLVSLLQRGKIKGSFTTSSDGLYTFSNLLAGIYDIRAVVNKDAQQVKRVSVGIGKETKVDFSFDKYVYKTCSRNIYVESRKKRDYVFYLSPSDPGYQIYDKSISVYKQRCGYDNGTYIDYNSNTLVIKIRLDGRWWRKAKFGAIYTIYTRKLVIEDTPQYGGNNSLVINESSMNYQEKVYYLYPSDLNYKIYKYEPKIHRCWNAEDNGSGIDYPNNRLVIKIKLKGYTSSCGMLQVITPAQYNATYYAYGMLPEGKTQSMIPMNIIEEKPIKKPKIILHKEPFGILSNEIKVSIMLSDIDDEIREAKINLNFDPARINIKDVQIPVFDDMEPGNMESEKMSAMSSEEKKSETTDSVLLNSNIDNTKGEANIEVAIVSFDEVYCDDVPTPEAVQQQTLNNQSIQEQEEKDIASIAELIISLPPEAKGMALSTDDILFSISITSLELKNAEGNTIETDIEQPEAKPQIPSKTELLQSFPNPAKDGLWIPFKLANDADVSLAIYNILGQKVRTIPAGQRKAGTYTKAKEGSAIFWDQRNKNGQKVSSGLYFYELKAGEFRKTRSMAVK